MPACFSWFNHFCPAWCSSQHQNKWRRKEKCVAKKLPNLNNAALMQLCRGLRPLLSPAAFWPQRASGVSIPCTTELSPPWSMPVIIIFIIFIPEMCFSPASGVVRFYLGRAPSYQQWFVEDILRHISQFTARDKKRSHFSWIVTTKGVCIADVVVKSTQ